MNLRILKLILAGGLVVSVAHAPFAAATQSAPNRFQLRVSLYPWIPEADSFVAFIESDFESKHPNIDLIVRPLVHSYDWEPQYVADLAYEYDKTAIALTDDTNPDFQHLVELDTLILGEVAERGGVTRFDVPGAHFLPAAAEAVRWQGNTVAVPHWTCGYFVISENPAIREVDDVDELVATLHAAGTPRVDVAGALAGSWDSITVYLDSFRDTYPHRSMRQALRQTSLDPVVADHLRALRPACTQDGINYCGGDAADLFAVGGSDALIGFSERLNPILSNPNRTVGELHIASATLGGGDRPNMFVDALVASPRCTSVQCRRAIKEFAAYYVSDETFEAALMSLDTSSGVPRYLLPSTSSALDFGLVEQDRLYRQLKQELPRSRAFPNSGVPEARDLGLIRAEVRAALGL